MNFPESIGRKARNPRTPRADYDEFEDNAYFPVTYSPVKAGIFQLYIFGPIYHANQFIPHIEALNAAGENDIVRIHLSTPGGSLDATDTFLQSMHECEGRVIIHASGGVHSAGSVILLNATEFTLSENFNMLIHNGSFGAYGDFNKAVAQAKHSQEYMENVMRTTYEGFLTPEEIEQMLEGKDFWLGPEEFCARQEKRTEYMKAKMAELMQPAAKPKRKPRPKPVA